MDESRKSGFNVTLVFLVTVWFIFFINGLFSLPLMPPDEPKYAYASFRMLKTGDFITPYFNCHPRFDKPPLIYWLIAISYKIFGISDWAARIPSVLATLGLIFIIWRFVEREIGSRAATLSVIVFSTVIHVWVMGRAVAPEMVLVFFETLAILLFYRGIEYNNRKAIYGAYISMSFAFITKGPVGVIMVLGAVFPYFLLKKGIKETVRSMWSITGIILFLLIGLPWYVAMILRHGYRYFYEFFLYHNIYRFTGQARQHPFGFYYYLPIFAGAFYLWWPYSVSAIRDLREVIKKRNVEFFLFLWVLFVLLFFTISVNKLHNYILISYPAASVLLASAIMRTGSESGTRTTRYIFIASLVIEASLVILIPVYVTNYHPFLLIGALMLSAITFLILRSNAGTERTVQMIILKALVLLMMVTFYIASYQSVVRPAELFVMLESLTAEKDPVYFYRDESEDMVFYARQCIPTLKNRDEVDEIVHKKKEFILFVRQRHLKELRGLKIEEKLPYTDINGRKQYVVEIKSDFNE